MRERNQPNKKFKYKITMKLMKLKLQDLSLALHPSALEKDPRNVFTSSHLKISKL